MPAEAPSALDGSPSPSDANVSNIRPRANTLRPALTRKASWQDMRNAIKSNLQRAQTTILPLEVRRSSLTGSSRTLAETLRLQDDARQKPEGWNRLVIPPNAVWKKAFDVIAASSILYSLLVSPVNVAFSPDGEADFLVPFSIFVEVIFVSDILLQFFHGYYDLGSRRLPVLELRRVVMQYGRPVKVHPRSTPPRSDGPQRPSARTVREEPSRAARPAAQPVDRARACARQVIPDVLSALAMPLAAISRSTFNLWQLLAIVRLLRKRAHRARRVESARGGPRAASLPPPVWCFRRSRARRCIVWPPVLRVL